MIAAAPDATIPAMVSCILFIQFLGVGGDSRAVGAATVREAPSSRGEASLDPELAGR